MKLDIICNKQDEFYTPEYAITPLQKYIENGKTVWCPFDTKQSHFVKIFSETNKVINTHLQSGVDFFDCEIPECDYIISNPPYSLKGEVFQRLFQIGKPFAMLVGVVGIFESQKRFQMFKNNDFEIMYFNKRISYFESYEDQRPKLNPPFSSVYLCKNILPKQIIFEEVCKK